MKRRCRHISRVVACAAAVAMTSVPMATVNAVNPGEEPAGTPTDTLSVLLMSDTLTVDSLVVPEQAVSADVSHPGRKVITPVESDDHKPEAPVLHYYDRHGNPLQQPVRFLTELDTVKKVYSGPVYPLLNGVSVGFNFFDAILMAAGQKYGGFDIWADLSLHNWFFPVIEAGAGFASSTPQDGNFTYTGKPSFYAKIGLNYNFLYKSNPDYQVFLGLRGGFSHFRYDITDITINSPYWDQSNRFSLMDQKATALYGEVLGGIKVKIYKNFSMGWTFRYHFKFHTSGGSNSSPWYIPGYGASSPIAATFSLIYTIPFHRSVPVEE